MVAIIFVGLIASSSYASQPQNEDEMIQIAAQSYMETNNVSYDEVVRRLHIMGDSYLIIEQLEQQYGDDMVGVYFDNNPQELVLVVKVVGKGKSRNSEKYYPVLDGKDKILVKVISNSPRNRKAINNILNNQAARLLRQIEGFQTLGYDPVKDVFIATIYEPNLEKQKELLSKPSLKKIAGISLEIIFIPKPLEMQNLKGGAPIQQNTAVSANLSNINRCTSGFPAVDSKGASGLVTAAHCVDSELKEKSKFTYIGYGKDVPVSMSVRHLDKAATNHDLMFIVPDNPKVVIGNSYYTSKTTTLTVRKETNPTVNSTICKYGQSTGYSCGQVILIDTITSSKQGCPAKMFSGIPCGSGYVMMKGSQLRVAGGIVGDQFLTQ